jgi:hypothetical protein
MKEDYLWDRTGTDAEIERLESLLGGLAFGPTEPLEVPVREIALTPARRGWLFKLSLGFAAASVAIAALLIAAISLREDSRPAIVATEETPVVAVPAAISPPITESGIGYQIASTAPQRKPRPKKRSRREAKSLPAPQPRPLPVITLTAEEADAYRQLMTALSVTGTNLSIVREKINGSEE